MKHRTHNSSLGVAPLVTVLALSLSCLFGPASRAQQENRQLRLETQPSNDAQRRVALVIGNGVYTNAPPLRNPPNDARDFGAALKEFGFEVTISVNATQREMKSLLREFGQKLRAGGSGLFYYAGHGVQSKGRNYLIPVEADIQSEAEVEDAGVDVNLMLSYMDEAQNDLNIVILDACRNNPFGRSFRSASNGLAQVDAPTGTLIAYATAPGRVASDGAGQNGLYTSELLKQMRVPGLSVTDMFMRVRAAVMKESGNKQVPWEASSLVGTFYFNAAKTGSTASGNSERTQPTTIDAVAVEREYWETIRNSSDAQDYKDYLQTYPNGPYAAIARTKIKQIETAKATGANPNPALNNTPPKSNANDASSAGNAIDPGPMPPNAPASLRSVEFLTVTLDGSGALKNRAQKSAYTFSEDLGGGVMLEMVAIPPGEFTMGSPANEADRTDDEGPQHRVRIGYWFYMGRFEVTQAQWRAIIGTSPSNFKNCDQCPVEQVSWDDAQEFCRKLSAKTGRQYRLPTEAEWEYAARAGTATPFAFGATITPEIVNYAGNSPYGSAAKGVYREKTITVGSLGVANGFGLYEMHGNVWEWCQDNYQKSYTAIIGDAPTDGTAWEIGGEETRVLRGGSWLFDANRTRSATRYRNTTNVRYGDLGFRVVVR